MDFFIYEDGGIRRLLSHCQTPEPVITIPVPGTDFIAVAIANAPGHIDATSLGSFEAMEGLTISYASELAGSPLMSGMAQSKGRDTVCITLTPLLCAVHLASIDNLLTDRPLLRKPRVYFRNANAMAQVLRQDGFRPSQTVESDTGLRSPELFYATLPEDIGYYRCEPDITLFCYPNDSPQASIGTPRTELVLEAETGDETIQFITVLPALSRGGVYEIHCCIKSGN